MASGEAVHVRRGVAMVGPPYLYNGAQVCGRRTGRTCIFLLASFGTAITLIGLVFFTADLRMESGLWIAGVVTILVGVTLLVWFLTLCCAARHAFRKLPPTHPARLTPSSSIILPPRSSTYQLLPMSPTRTQVTPTQIPATRTLPSSPMRNSNQPEVSAYPTWGHGARTKAYMAGATGIQPNAYPSGTSTLRHQGTRSYTTDYTHTLPQYPTSSPLTPQTMTMPTVVHTLTRPSAPHQNMYSISFDSTFQRSYQPPRTSLSGYITDDHPPPYHTVVSGP